jgi:hypothetical protein
VAYCEYSVFSVSQCQTRMNGYTAGPEEAAALGAQPLKLTVTGCRQEKAATDSDYDSKSPAPSPRAGGPPCRPPAYRDATRLRSVACASGPGSPGFSGAAHGRRLGLGP